MIARRLLLAAGAGIAARPARAAGPSRIITVGGAVTEMVFALGAGNRIIAVDSTSSFPAPVRALPQIGYSRALAPEGLIALQPDLLLMSEEAGPAQALAVLRAAGAPMAMIPEGHNGPEIARNIEAVGRALGIDAAPVAEAVRADWAALDAPIAALPKVRAIFVMSSSRGAPLAAGRNTQADAILQAAGATNVVTSYAGYRPLSAEAAAQLAPEAVVMMDHSVAAAGGIDALLSIPAFAVTPVAQSRRIVTIEGSYGLGFGPRAAHARYDLALALHPGANLPTLPRRAWV